MVIIIPYFHDKVNTIYVKYNIKILRNTIKINVNKLRDPFVLAENGVYYMFASYYSSKTNHRGCAILKSKSPEGPFNELTNGHITPSDWDAIDGTLYVDEDNQPWMVFVREWTSTEDKIGRMAAARLSEDLTHFISEPIELMLLLWDLTAP